MQLYNRVNNSFKHAQWVQLIVFGIFALSYIGRFLYYLVILNVFKLTDLFLIEIWIDTVSLIEGLSMGALLLLHYRNFSSSSSNPRNRAESGDDTTNASCAKI